MHVESEILSVKKEILSPGDRIVYIVTIMFYENEKEEGENDSTKNT